ncbi:short-chain fatty acids transporter [Bordetella pertussis]|uniref:Short-chain fatty acids transporter n=5 Tax=Bordetella pertussis TaxID=520 RepID=Q7VSI7_BORPE|nr:TIGR00366 family protein [Bordetella pertussis]ETH39664.1 TIGR00366 family protein [Bordetella pertussis H918]ETH42885.1 TIGR00366 family protein [Bordetella pertussis H939]ETH46994.1 TIGR00366 family protein [Bordetella pertussis H921]ETH70174.1 TIGR00366 family protein [Bordetella pertussis STO1-CHLA-0011]ETH82161.1 TIGR00366 family protein [Bordetella pertussis STO1-CHOC-0017]ETH88580.1 TIGR00366 family protein [Bordetella pertussis STO1-CHOC-0018]ETH98154.1 TIGR00366 family protein [B
MPNNHLAAAAPAQGRQAIASPMERFSQAMVAWAEKWFPDAYVFVVVACAVVALGAVLHGGDPLAVSKAFGEGFWSIIPFTMQMAMVAITGYVLALSPPVARLLRALAHVPSTPRGAVVFIGTLSILLSLVNWGLSLIFSGLLVREMARRTDLRLDYRAAGAAGYLGLGCGFTLGMSSSAAQLQATPASIPASLMPITGVIGFSETILTWQNLVVVILVTVVSGLVCYFTAPSPERSLTAQDLGVDLTEPEAQAAQRQRPGDYLEFSPWLTVAVVGLASGWLYLTFRSGNPFITMSQLNTYNFVFLLLGLLLHWRPRSFLESFGRAMPSIGGVMLQFPFYGGIGYVLTKVANVQGHTLSDAIAHWFVSLAHDSSVFSILVSIYSAFLGFFIPSAGGKWVIEAPYIMDAANQIQAHLGWTVMVYNIAETLPNFINPFWMLPLLGILRLKSKDLVGYTAMQFLVHFPIVVAAGAILMHTFSYVPPVIPGQ